jgi:hypothetical protein
MLQSWEFEKHEPPGGNVERVERFSAIRLQSAESGSGVANFLEADSPSTNLVMAAMSRRCRRRGDKASAIAIISSTLCSGFYALLRLSP